MKQVAESLEGFRGMILMGKDGFAVERYGNMEGELDNLVVELLGILKKLDQLVELSGDSSEVNDLIIESREYNYFVKPLSEEYFVFMITARQEFSGKCRYQLSKAADLLRKELQ
jgi:predicted regulator of Ras-like GTPase activity (Roadblock/LC7/MglB family)